MGHVERSFRKGAAYVSDSFQPLFPYRYRVYAIARITILVFSRTLISLRPVLLGHASCWELVIARRHACAKIFDSGIIVIMGLHERNTVGDSVKRATAIGLCAVVLWSMMFGFVRLTTQSFGPALGSALIYSCAAVFTYIGYRPTPLRRLPLKYVLFSGGLFVFYETAITISIGLAASSEQTLELSLVNYLWPTMLVLLSAFDSGSRASLVRALCLRLVATIILIGARLLPTFRPTRFLLCLPLPPQLLGRCIRCIQAGFRKAAMRPPFSWWVLLRSCGQSSSSRARPLLRWCEARPRRGRLSRLASVFRPCGRCRLHCFGLCLLGAWHAQGRHGENGHRVLCRSFAFGCGEHHHSRRKSHAAVLVWHFRRSGRLPH